jgi:hypothetical protein
MGAIPSAVELEDVFDGQTSRALRHRNSTSRGKATNQTTFIGTKSLNKHNSLNAIKKGAA